MRALVRVGLLGDRGVGELSVGEREFGVRVVEAESVDVDETCAPDRSVRLDDDLRHAARSRVDHDLGDLATG